MKERPRPLCRCDVCDGILTSVKTCTLVLPAGRGIPVESVLEPRRHVPIIAHNKCFGGELNYYIELERLVLRGDPQNPHKVNNSLYMWLAHLKEKDWFGDTEAVIRAHHLAKAIVKAGKKPDAVQPTEARSRATSPPIYEEGDMPKTSIFIEGEDISVVTDARDERDFTEGFSPAFAKVVAANGKNPAGTARAALTAGFDIIAKMRGYKSSVQERRVLSAGRWPHPNERPVAESISEDSGLLEATSTEQAGE